MADLSIRNLDDDVRRRLRVRAAEHGLSMEAEVRQILTEAVADEGLAARPFSALRESFAAIGGVDLQLPARDEPARSATFVT
ncbi:MAG: Arc family DNA-binding protein [Mycobacteriales bacterium]|nr:Arc family DNA-binding protein [Mycobacteriales bacterium]